MAREGEGEKKKKLMYLDQLDAWIVSANSSTRSAEIQHRWPHFCAAALLLINRILRPTRLLLAPETSCSRSQDSELSHSPTPVEDGKYPFFLVGRRGVIHIMRTIY